MSTALSSSRRLTAGLALAAAVALGTAACSSDDPTSDAGPGPTAVSTTTTAVATTAAPTTAAPPAAPTGVADPAAAATRLYDAWVAGDRTAALAIADPAAVDAIWAATPGPYELYRGCDTGEFDTGGCLFRDRSTNNTIQVDVERRDTGWVVAGTFFSAG